MRQIAWLTATPKLKAADGTETKLPPRMESYKEREVEPPLPPLESHRLYDWFMKAGPTIAGDMGPKPLSAQELEAWSRGTGKRLACWEFDLLLRMSRDYLGESHLAEDHMRAAPWTPTGDQVDHAANEHQLRSVLG
ncbi:hypothetical protein O4H52_07875 [Sphingomonadaceae bacterium G21617-S1]|nr:hypothetical protein [Sphingomonadaceae bacterium G21617-S1]